MVEKVLHGTYENLLQWLPALLTALLIFAVFWLLALGSRSLIRRYARRSEQGRANVLRLVQQIVYLTLLTVGLVTALGTAGVNVAALVTSLGLAGFALGFALKDALSNLISGVLLLLYRPFTIGDEIIVSGFEGTVTAIDLRYTTLQLDKRIVFIPNSKLFTESVVFKQKEEMPATPENREALPPEVQEEA